MTEENVFFAACFALRGHADGTHINILWFCSWSARFVLGCKSIRINVLINIRTKRFTLVREFDGLIKAHAIIKVKMIK